MARSHRLSVVAQAEPSTPIAGKPKCPKMRIQLRTALTTLATTMATTMDAVSRIA